MCSVTSSARRAAIAGAAPPPLRSAAAPPRAATDVEEEVAVEERTSLAPPWKVIVHDDPITLMSYVTMVFRKVFGYSYPKSYRLMMLVHTTGRAVVWTGAKEQAELYVQKLHSHQLLASMEEL